MGRGALIGALLGLILLGGCSHSGLHPHGGKMIAEYKPCEDAQVKKTPYQANYVLYHWPKPPCDPPPQKWIPENEVIEVFVRGLGKRQPIGFEKAKDGQLFAVAGDEKISIEMGRYCWHIHPSTEYRGLKWFVHETGDRIVEIASLPFGLVAAAIFCVCLLPLFLGFLFVWPFLLFMI